ncbi:hypothetical protein MHK_000245 [Candidatus Magnetomorum sp. HK-1]|nr:hypothetical protein MHK_000245 [Candidatus Magnetomorum sp. HK-1]
MPQWSISKTGLDELLRQCTVQISIKETETSGTGFFVAPKHIITCAHVVEYAYDSEANIIISWDGEEFDAKIKNYYSKPYPDIAILNIETSGHPCVYCNDTLEIGDNLYSYGYPENQSDGDSALFTYEGPTNSLKPLLKLKDAQTCPGLSGAPILNLKTGCVCGIVKSSRDVYSDLGGRAIPISILDSFLSEIISSHYEFHENDKSWARHLSEVSDTIKTSFIEFRKKTIIGLEAIGYNVIEKELPNHLKVELYAELPHMLHVHRIVVKLHHDLSLLDADIVRNFNSDIDAISTKENPITGIIVSSFGFTIEGKQIAKKLNIGLFLFDDLLKQSFDPNRIIQSTLNFYDSDELRKVYVDLSCQVTESGKGTIYKPVEKFFDSFFSSTKRPGIALLGNFGSGKTSLCKHYSYLLANRWLDEKSRSFLPIYVNLRDINDFQSIEKDLLTLIHTIYETPVTEKGWNQWLLNGSTMILFDGFDEMASKMDKTQINYNLEYLMRFCILYNIKIILSCRTHFFKTQVEEQTLGNMLRLYLCDWGTDELKEYISKSLPQKKESSLEIIKSTYNLEELSKTPIFLKMITTTIEDIGGYVNQAKLYDIYTNRWMQSQDYRSKLSPEDKQLLMEELAMEMFLNDMPRLEHSLLPKRLKGLFGISGYEVIKILDRDVRTCSFLIRNPEGDYYFVHKSFMEFFVALKLAKEIKNNIYENFSKKLLSFEITSFFINYFEDNTEIFIRGLFGNPEKYTRANFAMSLGQMGFNETTFNSLKMAIKTDKSDLVQFCAIDSLFLFSEQVVIEELTKLSSEDNEIGNYCLKKLGAYSQSIQTITLFKHVIGFDENPIRICAVLDNIASYEMNDLLDDLDLYIKSNKWRKNNSIIKSIASAMLAISDLKVAKKFNMLLNSVSEEIIKKSLENTLDELKIKFRIMIESEARENKTKGIKRRENEGKIHSKYGLLVDDEQFKTLLIQLYPTAKTKFRKGISKSMG